jgi:hypothetical protein
MSSDAVKLPKHWPQWVKDRFSKFFALMDEVYNHPLLDNADPWTDGAAMSPAKIFLSELNWEDPAASGPKALGAILGGTERNFEKTDVDDYMHAINKIEELWPFLKQVLQNTPTAEELENRMKSFPKGSVERESIAEFLAESKKHESSPAEMALTYCELIQNVIDIRPIVETLAEKRDQIISVIRESVSIAAKQPSHEMQDFLGAYKSSYEAPTPDFEHWAPHEKVHMMMLFNHKNVSEMKNAAVLRRWIVRLLGSSGTYNQRRIDKIRERLNLKLSGRGRPRKNTTE